MAHNHVYPTRVLSRDISKSILGFGEDLEVRPSEVVGRVEQMRKDLKLVVNRVDVTTFSDQDADAVRGEFGFSELIPVIKEAFSVVSSEPGGGAIIYWRKPDGGAHYTSLDPNTRFQGEEIEGGNIGGQEGVNEAKKWGYIPVLVFHLKKAE